MTSRRTGALFAASCALGGCNVLVGLDGVNIVQDGSGGGAGAGNAAEGSGAATSTPPAGGTPGAGAEGGDGAAGPTGSAGDDETSTSTSGGGASTSTAAGGAGGGGASTSGSGGSTMGGGGSTTGGAGGMPPNPCGDGAIGAGEQCDDGNSAPGDGCSDACKVEPFHQCTTPGPSVCTKQEVLCADGADGDGDGLVDGMDTDCSLPAYAPGIACNALRVYRSVNVPIAIPEKGGGAILSPIVVDGGLNIAHTAVLLDISHEHAGDLNVVLIPPFGSPRTLTSYNGGTGADYDMTLFDGACLMSVTVGIPPFQGCFKPESPLPSAGQPAAGVWTLAVSDDAIGETGTLHGWALILCAQ